MRHFTITAVSKATGQIEHCATSDLPLNVNPFADMANTHNFDYGEFDNNADVTMVRAREFLEAIEATPQGIAMRAGPAKPRIASLRKHIRE